MKPPSQGAFVALCLIVAALGGSGATATAPASTNSWNTTLQFNASGDPGDWILLVHEVPKPAPKVYTVIINFEFVTHGAGEAFDYALLPPTLMVQRPVGCCWPYGEIPPLRAEGENPPVDLVGELRVYHEPEGDERSYQQFDYPWLIASPQLDGFAFLAASSVAWRANLTLQFLEGNQWTGGPIAGPFVEPSFVSRGQGAKFFRAEETPLLEDHVGQVQAEFSYGTPGWTHAQYNWDNFDPIHVGVHHHDFQFPNGFRYVGPQVDSRIDLMPQGLPLNMEPVPVRSVGTMLDVPGTLRIQIMRAADVEDVSVYVLHLPMDEEDFPPRLQRWSYGCETLDPDFNDEPAAGGHVCNEERVIGTPHPI